MLTFLFWNLQKKPLQDSLYRLVERHKVDVLLLAENAVPIDKILLALNRETATFHHCNPDVFLDISVSILGVTLYEAMRESKLNPLVFI
jgi:hypothetical protein